MKGTQTAVQREGREDRAALFAYAEGVVVVVADGAGGMGGGAAAAEAVVEAVRERGWSSDVSTWVELLGRLDASVAPGQTTAVVVALSADSIACASVGDSGAWWFDAAGGEYALTQGQRRKPLLGSGEAEPAGATRVQPGAGTLVVASDGLWKYVAWTRVHEALHRAPEVAARELVEAVRLPSGRLPDDVAVVVCRRLPG